MKVLLEERFILENSSIKFNSADRQRVMPIAKIIEAQIFHGHKTFFFLLTQYFFRFVLSYKHFLAYINLNQLKNEETTFADF